VAPRDATVTASLTAAVTAPPAARAADLVVLDGTHAREVLTRHRPPRHVLRAGRPVATTVVSDLHGPARSPTVAGTDQRSN
jgi:hypothetical protein